METNEQIEAFLELANEDGLRGQLLDRGTAWSVMRRNGILPNDSPPLGDELDVDLAEYGFALLRGALALHERDGSQTLKIAAFEKAGNAFESLVRNVSPDMDERGFYRTIAGGSFHLAGFSAIAYSLLNAQAEEELNLNPAEEALARLILRDLDSLHAFCNSWLTDPTHSDAEITRSLENDEVTTEEALSLILNSAVCRSLAYFEFALRTGEPEFVTTAQRILETALELADDAGAVTLWWIIRLCRSLIGDLWRQSLHQSLPWESPPGGEETYQDNRRFFITSLYARRNAEIELWPSQIEAARRLSNMADDLVVALPTSAGKTRIAEIAALLTLSVGKRVLIVTPLRALSAQTERSFRKTFGPLGYSVSALYGASGMTAGDADALRTNKIVIATPEKLDFALRSDSEFINDIGLIVLDEGHMIGPGEREIRYEILVQRLLRRADVGERRIICLSAILPDGKQLDDLNAWIRDDADGEPIKSDWRPTRQRFGTLVWNRRAGRLNYDLDQDGPFITRFVRQLAPIGLEKKPYPRDVRDLTIMTAWEFAQQGKRTLVFVTQANWVKSYGVQALNLVKRGYLTSLLVDDEAISDALKIGREWLGENHPAVECLNIGIAVHYGDLPSPYLRELEKLLTTEVIKVTIASPTLSQGLNLNAGVLLVPYLIRSGVEIGGEELANVAGRAGRAFVDVEGLVLHVIFDDARNRTRAWRRLVTSTQARSLTSGLLIVIDQIAKRLSRTGILKRDDAYEYLANSREAWVLDDENEEAEPIEHLVEKLDTIVFGLIEALDAEADDLPRLLDEALAGSLWARQVERLNPGVRKLQSDLLNARAKIVWRSTTPASRIGFFAMGVGLETGLVVDNMADALGAEIDRADLAAQQGDSDALIDALCAMADRLLNVRPFVPASKNSLKPDWRGILASWIGGLDIAEIGPINMGMIEDAFTYRLVWALEAIRARRISNGWEPEIGVIAGAAAACLETGVPDYRISMLVRAGLPSRRAGIAAVAAMEPMFFNVSDMRAWLASDAIEAMSQTDDWPTLETATLWRRFRVDMLSGQAETWTYKRYAHPVAEALPEAADYEGYTRVELDEVDGSVWITTPDYRRLKQLTVKLTDPQPSVLFGKLVRGEDEAQIHRIGRSEVNWIY